MNDLTTMKDVAKLAMRAARTGGPDEVTLNPDGAKVMDLAMPDLVALDNVEDVETVELKRVRVPVRVDHLEVHTVANGYTVNVRNAGRQSMFGPDGSNHAFSGPDAKSEMLVFIGTVIGQIAYQYREIELDQDATASVQPARGGG